MLIVLGPACQPLDHAEMVAQDMRDVGVGFAEANDDFEQFADRTSRAAGVGRQPQCAQPRLSDQVDLGEWQGALALAFACALRNMGE